MKPFLLLATRAEDAAADEEYEAFLRFSGLDERDLRRHRLERTPLGDLALDDWSGILLGGGPFNVSDPADAKTPVQQRVEKELHDLIGRIVAEDFPFLGACYGIGTLGGHQGGVIDRTYGEPVGAVEITVVENDPLFADVPTTFEAFVGHKEAIRELPDHAVVLARSEKCPVQAFRIGQNVYATQFHPELDAAGLATRVDVYKYAGYFRPEEADEIKALAYASDVKYPPAVLQAFIEKASRAPSSARRSASRG
ncbi:glutamine amidotransferase [Cryptosporangium phraense]|uniref:Glutamine amidotransferase n=1 Tax=Cryptosporangium phraense TaxID=2593070 RepID=A0A545AET1_9ACTN|nr:glutamine amidotransferase [Cryptosporangium phraense]TQS39823.1 glutamine amidotransferase [Cryptosporangium phraense]